MLRKRVIPVLLVQQRGLVKTTGFERPRYVGDPLNAIRIFNEKEVDELVLLDIEATRSGRGPDLGLIRDVASECFMPLAYGGGINTRTAAAEIFSLGVEKVILRTAAATQPSLVRAIADHSGSQSVAVSIDVRRTRLGKRRIHAPGTPLDKSGSWLEFAQQATDQGAGEILLQSVERDGTGLGLDTEMIAAAARSLRVPIVAAGGVGGMADIKAGVDAGASAIGVGRFFVFHGPRQAVLITYPDYAALEELLSN